MTPERKAMQEETIKKFALFLAYNDPDFGTCVKMIRAIDLYVTYRATKIRSHQDAQDKIENDFDKLIVDNWGPDCA